MIAIIDYGVGNLFSLRSSLTHLGLEAVVTADAQTIRRADRLILPGVGAFGDAMDKLSATGLVPVIREQAAQKPLLGICLGMQPVSYTHLDVYKRQPLLGLLREALENGYRGPVLWLHYVRHPGQRAWLGELEALAARHPNLELRWSLTRGARADGCLEGHFQPRHLDGWAADLARSQALACGPAAFVEAVGEQLGARFAGLQTESFSVPRWRLSLIHIS